MPDDEEARARMAEHDRIAAEEAERWIEKAGLEGAEAELFRNRGRHFILIDGEPVPVGLYEWAKWFENTPQRIVGQEDVDGPDDQTYYVSTVFLGTDHSFFAGPLILFETMIFRRHEPETMRIHLTDGTVLEHTHDREEVFAQRYSTLTEAEAGHEVALEMAKLGDFDDDAE